MIVPHTMCCLTPCQCIPHTIAHNHTHLITRHPTHTMLTRTYRIQHMASPHTHIPCAESCRIMSMCECDASLLEPTQSVMRWDDRCKLSMCDMTQCCEYGIGRIGMGCEMCEGCEHMCGCELCMCMCVCAEEEERLDQMERASRAGEEKPGGEEILNTHACESSHPFMQVYRPVCFACV